ncbi:hypothetical protein SS50377_28365 [Spironucleus salmonicida]|uniref:Uncharacterized protein n=1 Tax=Spironucleus salmonicida TaxID=348837 RepID=A0A9P8RU91_9EUKA|nr:hypothetical protein SS50377_28365 [Spironucleus salmonicida]
MGNWWAKQLLIYINRFVYIIFQNFERLPQAGNKEFLNKQVFKNRSKLCKTSQCSDNFQAFWLHDILQELLCFSASIAKYWMLHLMCIVIVVQNDECPGSSVLNILLHWSFCVLRWRIFPLWRQKSLFISVSSAFTILTQTADQVIKDSLGRQAGLQYNVDTQNSQMYGLCYFEKWNFCAESLSSCTTPGVLTEWYGNFELDQQLICKFKKFRIVVLNLSLTYIGACNFNQKEQ